MRLGTYFILFATCVSVGRFATPSPFLNSYLSQDDRNSLAKLFDEALTKKSDDIASIHYAAAGYKLLGSPIDAAKAKTACEKAKQVDLTALKDLYHVTGATSALPNCALSSIATAQKTIESAASESQPSALNLLYALETAKNLGLKVNQADFDKALTTAFKDDSSASIAYALVAASLLDKNYATKYFDHIKDFVGQADEVDGKYLQLEGGISVTALGLHGVYSLAEKAGKAPVLKNEEVVKFANYILSRRGAPLERPAFLLLQALNTLAKNPYHVPLTLSLATPLTLDQNKQVQVRVSDVFGDSVGTPTVSLESSTPGALTRRALTKVADDKTNTLYVLDLKNEKLESGFYKLIFSASTKDKKHIGVTNAQISVKVPTVIAIEDVQVAVFERDLTKPNDYSKVKQGDKLSSVLKLDSHQKLHVKFSVKDQSANKLITVHQAFAVLVHDKTNREVIYVAEADATSKAYLFELDLKTSEKDFGGLTGTYHLRLLIGDPIVSNSIDWHLADVAVSVAPVTPPEVKKSEKIIYDPLPTIQHKFREPEPLPPHIMSDTFTTLCLAPLLLLFILWLRVGINFGNIRFSLWALGFHVGIAAIFGLYFCFWLKLNMFVTLKYLAIIGVPTFICGNRLLRSLHDAKKPKTE
jgi:oligosaccharyltransferase complex subunit delta (ribophorin II)